jgi:cysteine desulfurase/selenocysteine lyase
MTTGDVPAGGLPNPAAAPSPEMAALTPTGAAPGGLASVGPGADAATFFGQALERLANEYFSGVPGTALNLPLGGAASLPLVPGLDARLPAPGPVAPPSGVLPAAASVGAGGISPGSGAIPPFPGFVQQPPIASGPWPKESDLRTLPAMLSELTGLSSPVALAGAPESLPGLPEGFPGAFGQGMDPHFPFGSGFSVPLVPGHQEGGSLSGSPTVPSGVLPSAAIPGAYGLSPGSGALPAAPGVLQHPPIGSAPPPKQPDSRGLSTGASDLAGISSPAGLDTESASDADMPYFMQIAGLPKSAPYAREAAPPPGHGSGLPGQPLPAHAAPSALPGRGASSFPGGSSFPGSSSFPGAPSFPGSAMPGSYAQHADPGKAEPYARNDAGKGPSPDAYARHDGVRGQRPESSARTGGDAGVNGSRPEPYTPDYRADTRHLASADASGAGGADPNTRRLFDPLSIKRDFPILQERIHGRQLVWLDNAATTQKPRAVIDRISYFYEHENSNIHRAAHTLAARATDAYESARATTRRFLNAGSVNEIVFGRGTTELINLVAQSWGRRHLQAGDEVVISWLEHHANIVPWQLICKEKGARLRVAPVDDRGQVLLDEYEKLLNPRTRFVSLSHVSNALGTIVPVTEMVAMARRYGARVLIDGAQAVSHLRVDVQAIDCDFYVFSGHKIFGPTGIGALFGKADAFESMPPWQGGGNMIRDVTFEKTTYQAPPARFEAGTPNIADAVGLGAALDYVTSIGLENIARYEHDLLEYATERLCSVSGLRLFGTAADKAGVLSFVVDGLNTEELGEALDREGIAVRAGHHCAQPILRRFGVERTVRGSLAPYNTCEDIDALVSALLRLKAARY